MKLLALDDSEEQSCFNKRDLALKLKNAEIPLDTKEETFRLVYTTVHKAGP
jgi:hypothetical protein